jgi:hypothetical protein
LDLINSEDNIQKISGSSSSSSLKKESSNYNQKLSAKGL